MASKRWNTCALLILLVSATLSLSAATTSASDMQAKIAGELQKKSEFNNIQTTVENGTVTLTGTVKNYQQKVDLEKKIAKLDKKAKLNDLVTVNTETVPDPVLEAKLQQELIDNRIGYFNVFDYLKVNVSDGIARVEGEVRLPIDKQTALEAVNTTPGVKGVIDEIRVSPASFSDDRIRFGELRAIYGDSVLGRYGIDPKAPIRIIVDNGHVTLDGWVESTMDRNIAGIRANQVSGAFSVTNNLLVDRG
jgi:hyperosmotically inducible periplasmic protein